MLDEANKHIREAIMLGRTDIMKKLLEEVKGSMTKADPENGDVQYDNFLNGVHPQLGSFLHDAVKHGKKDVVRALLQEGADPGLLDEAQDTAVDLINNRPEMRQVFSDVLMQAAASGYLDQMERLLRAGIEVSVIDTPTSQNTPLHWAASFGSAVTVQILLEQFGADPNLTNAKGMTALHDAVTRGDPNIVKVLVKFGADPTIACTTKEKTALDLSSHSEEMTKILKSSSYLHSSSLVNGVPPTATTGEKTTLPSTPNTATDVSEKEAVNAEVSTPPTEIRATALSPVPPVITDERFNLLCPSPKHMHQLSDEVNFLPERMTISISPGIHSIHDILDVWDIYRGLFARIKKRIHLSESRPRCASEATIHCSLNASLLPCRGSYKLTISNHRIKILASDVEGLRHAIVTLIQILSLFSPSSLDSPDVNSSSSSSISGSEEDYAGVTSVAISDWPDFAMRAVLIDLNPYGRVPKMDILLGLIDTWALIKINQFHAFFRVGTSDASYLSYSKRDYMTLDRYARERGVVPVPAIDVDASVTSVEDLGKLRTKFRDILRCFDHPKFIHLGPKITSILVSASDGNGGGGGGSTDASIYDYIPLPLEETTFILCANSLHGTEDLNLLPENVILAHYGFQKNEAFSNALAPFVAKGLPVAICCGTSAWSNLAGNPEVAINNSSAAMRALRKNAGIGVINAHWSSHPSMTHVAFAYPSFLLNASLSWNSDIPESYLRSVLPDLLDAHVFGQCGYRLDGTRSSSSDNGFSPGKALMDLGYSEALLDRKRLLHAGSRTTSSESLLLRILMAANDVESLNDFGIAVQQLKKSQNNLLKCNLKSPRSQSICQELFLTSELLVLAARIGRGLTSSSSKNAEKAASNGSTPPTLSAPPQIQNLPPTFRTDIANKALTLVEQYRALWLSRYEPQGMQASLLVLSNLLSKFIPEGSEKMSVIE